MEKALVAGGGTWVSFACGEEEGELCRGRGVMAEE